MSPEQLDCSNRNITQAEFPRLEIARNRLYSRNYHNEFETMIHHMSLREKLDLDPARVISNSLGT